MRIAIVAVGKIKQAGLRTELDDYLARIRRYAACDEIELKDGEPRELIPRLERALSKRGTVAALEIQGRVMDSHAFASFIGRHSDSATDTLSFVIGGAYGLPDAIVERADLKLSLSKMTFPHRLARVVLAEQIYRAFTILRGEPYSH
jgi:23S rRNA (pseudouridine1915-N3)-methyltransferase